MRVGIDARKYADFGIGTYIRGLLGGLAEIRGDDEYVVFAPAEAREVVPAGFTHVVVDAPNYSIRELFVIGRAIARARLDVFHAPHYVVPFTRCPTVVTIHDLIHLHVKHRNPLAPLYARAMLRRAVRKSKHVLTVSESVRREIESTFPGARVTVTPNGVDAAFLAPAPVQPATRYFLFVGNDKPHKNVDRVMEAFKDVHGEMPDVTLLLAGSAFERFHGIDGVIANGFVKTAELAWLYRHAVALLQPSIEEGFGLPSLEAMASGTAVIASNHPSLVEVTGDAALHVDAFSSLEIAAAMRRLLADTSLRMTLARRGIERARTFTWRRCAESTRAIYASAFA